MKFAELAAIAAAALVLCLPATAQPMPERDLRVQINTLAVSGRNEEAAALAEPLLQQARRDAAAGGAGTQFALLNALGGSARLYLRGGNEAQALELYGEALALYGKVHSGPDAVAMLRLLPVLLPPFGQLAGKLEQHALAVQRLEPLLALPGMASPAMRLTRLEVHSSLGRIALHAGDMDAAERALMLALQERQAAVGVMLDTPIPLAAGRQVYGDLTTLRNVEQRILETIGAMGQNHQASGSDGRPARDFAVRHSWPDADTPVANLVRLYGKKGKSGQLLQFYQGQFASYASAMQKVPQEEGYVELEMEYALFGAALSAAGQWQAAHQAIGEALRLNALRLSGELAYMTPDYAGHAFATRRDLVHLLLSHQLAAGAVLQDRRDAAGELLQGKALGSRLQAQRAAALRRSSNPAVASLQGMMNRLDPNASLAEYYQQWSLDTQLQALVAPLMAPLQLTTGAKLLTQLQQSLGQQKLLAFSVFQPFDFVTMKRLPARYIGQSISRHGVELRDLGAADEIEAELAQWRRELLAPPADGAVPGSSARLYRRLLQPLLGARAADGHYVALPDGALTQLPLEALVDESGQYLLARGPWRYLSSIEQMLTPASEEGALAASGGAVIFGAPDFDASLPAASASSISALRPALQQLRFPPLPGAAAEAQTVAALLRGAGQQVTLYTGANASAAQLRALRRPHILHLATHGFFLGEAAGGSEEVVGRDGQRYLHDLQVPHFNSGLALTGANSTAASVRSPGLVFSFQLRQLDLEGTDLVVLSACESGAGMQVAGETVDSLRQSLEAAGARNTITTLWQVSDAASAELMQHFYQRLAGGMDKGEALQQAKLALAVHWRQPFYWAPYILSGAH